MREIFRAKRVDNGEWVEGNFITGKNNTQTFIGYISAIDNGMVHDIDIAEVNPETVCQSIGLIDKNGVRIFEGDIVVLNDEDERFIIEWDPNAARFILKGKTFVTDFDSYWGYQTEIIGNAFDNT